MAIPVLDFKKFRDSQVRALRSGTGGGVIPGIFKGPDPEAGGRALVEIGTEGNIVSVPHGGGVFPIGGEVLVQVNDDLVPTGLLAGGSAAGGETVALGATGEAIQAQDDKLSKSLTDMSERVKAAAEGPVDTGRLRAGEVLIKGDLIAGDTVGARHIVASEELEAKLATFRKITTDEIVAGKAKIGGDLIADTLEGKKVLGGEVTVRADNGNTELRLSHSTELGPVLGFRSARDPNGDTGKGLWPLALYMAEGNDGRLAGPTLHMEGGEEGGQGVTGVSLDLGAKGVYTSGRFISWASLYSLVAKAEEASQKNRAIVQFRDLDRDWKREPRPFEIVREAGSDVVDLFGGEWVRQNGEWNYSGNTWYEWKLGIPTALLPKQWVHFTVVITEDNYLHFAQGVIKPDGTFGLKLDKGIRVKPNVSRIMIPPVRWHL